MTVAAWSSKSDEELMAMAARDDLRAFETLVQRHQDRVYRMAYHMLGNEEDAWDASQDIFIKVYHARDNYVAENAKFSTWLYRIANNAVIDKIRQHKRRSHLHSLEDEAVREPESQDRSVHQNLQLEEIKGQMSKALCQLSERQRGMVIMKYYEGFSTNEIAEVFDCAVGTVKATLFQAIRNLRGHLNTLGVQNAEVTS